MNEFMKKLAEPFPSEDIEWRIGRDGSKQDGTIWATALAYVTNRAIQNRLDDVFGIFGWKNEYKEWKKDSQICGISAYNPETKEWITKWDGADDTNFESTKGGLSDSMKRAAVHWGIGRYLYDLEEYYVTISDTKTPGCKYQAKNDKKGLKAYYWIPPDLPTFALPDRTSEIKEHLTNCSSVDECSVLWNSLTKAEQNKLKNAFSAKKAELTKN